MTCATRGWSNAPKRVELRRRADGGSVRYRSYHRRAEAASGISRSVYLHAGMKRGPQPVPAEELVGKDEFDEDDEMELDVDDLVEEPSPDS